MKVFISWSGDISGKVAREFRDWLPYMFPSIQPYVSIEDIDKGTRWNHEISRELDTASFGILCVTKDNINSPWLNFEAGALSKSIKLESLNRVCPFLFGLAASDISGPLQQFQATTYEKEDIRLLIFSINTASGNTAQNEARLQEAFNVWWPKLYEKLEQIYKLIKKKIVLAFETSDLDAEAEIKMMAAEGLRVSKKWYVAEENPPNPEECDLLIYVFGKSKDSTARLTKVVEFARILPLGTSLIVYTRYASGDGRLTDKEFSITHTHGKSVIANMPETLNQQLKKMI